jgi:hypothetical protein
MHDGWGLVIEGRSAPRLHYLKFREICGSVRADGHIPASAYAIATMILFDYGGYMEPFLCSVGRCDRVVLEKDGRRKTDSPKEGVQES